MTLDRSHQIPSQISHDVSVFDLLRVALEHLKMLLLVPVLIGIVVTALVYFLVAPRFTSSVKFIAPQPPASMGAGALSVLGIQALTSATFRNPSEIYISLLNSNRIRDAIIKQFKLSERYKDAEIEELREYIQNQSEVKLSKDGIITISFTDNNRELAADIANSYPGFLQQMMTEFSVIEANTRKDYFSKQASELREKVKRQEESLKQSNVSVDMLKLDMNSSVGEIASLKAVITSQEIKIRSLATYLSPNAPEYKLALSELNSSRAQLGRVESSQVGGKNVSSYPEIYRSYLYNLQLLENLIKQAELAEFDANKDAVLIQVVDKAEPSERKSGPSYLKALLITVIASFLLIAFKIYSSFYIEYFHIKHPEFPAKWRQVKESWRSAWRIR